MISDMADAVCSFNLLAPVRRKCLEITKNIIERHFYIIREFTILYTPRDVCEMIKLCPNEDESNSDDNESQGIIIIAVLIQTFIFFIRKLQIGNIVQ